MLTDLLGVIAVGLADESDGIRQQDVSLRFLRFVFLPLFVFFIRYLLHGGYLSEIHNQAFCFFTIKKPFSILA